MSDWLKYTLLATDGNARAGIVETPRGTIPTPVFMPVGTQGSVKGIDPQTLKELGASICLGNTYHLLNRPGPDRVQHLGGLHKMMHWDRPILTDSGGFQVFSLANLREMNDDGVTFRSHLDGALLEMTPESAILTQEKLGSDIMMPLDVCPPHPCTESEMSDAMRRTTLWAKRCVSARRQGALFAIVQGGVSKTHRTRHVNELGELAVDGFSIGGLSVGEDIPLMYETAEHTAALLPKDKPRYLMGVGTPEVLISCIGVGVDL
ncbi:MAG TPA: tRNA guanosine(34) transglycosylase Tgt, partial [Myxococcales bacterium]|nr:tRNA guanosine(34) transglycosylase Tgt [Myxococcales bacterium]